jgi:hypothetical protein
MTEIPDSIRLYNLLGYLNIGNLNLFEIWDLAI